MASATRPAALLSERLDSTRILLFGGILLIVLGMVLGEIYAIFVSHIASVEIRERLFTVVSAVGTGDTTTIHAQFDVIEQLLEKRGRIVNTHSHSIAFGFLALVLTVLQPMLGLAEQRKRLFAWLIIAGAFLQSLCVFVSPYVGLWGNWASDVGAALVLVGVLGTLIGLFARWRSPGSLNSVVAPLLQSRSSRILLVGGGLLILLGMLMGVYYAWVFVTQHEPQQWTLLDVALAQALAGEEEGARSTIASYRHIQSKIAIQTAAHSHAIEFGMLAILLGIVQNFVLLDDRWKLRWIWAFLAGSFLLPVFVFTASIVGLVSAGFADLSGFVALVALCAMAVGIIRYTGARDYSGKRSRG